MYYIYIHKYIARCDQSKWKCKIFKTIHFRFSINEIIFFKTDTSIREILIERDHDFYTSNTAVSPKRINQTFISLIVVYVKKLI